jgi:hypothetical protein
MLRPLFSRRGRYGSPRFVADLRPTHAPRNAVPQDLRSRCRHHYAQPSTSECGANPFTVATGRAPRKLPERTRCGSSKTLLTRSTFRRRPQKGRRFAFGGHCPLPRRSDTCGIHASQPLSGFSARFERRLENRQIPLEIGRPNRFSRVPRMAPTKNFSNRPWPPACQSTRQKSEQSPEYLPHSSFR